MISKCQVFKNKITGVPVAFLAAGSCNCVHGVNLVAIYCPLDNEHDIYVMPQELFYENYEAVN